MSRADESENAGLLAELAFLRLEHERLVRERTTTPGGFYAEHGVFAFKGKSAVRRENTPPLPCGCRMYRDVLTPGRWRALGRMIAAGESAVLRVGRTWNTPISCRCQLVDDSSGDARTETEDINDIPF